jgi:hypothetical protein
MPFLRSVFGPSKDEIWSQVSADIGAEFVDGGFWGKDEVRYQSGEWELLLDTFTVSSGKSSSTYTRLRAPFVNKDGLYFKIYRENILSSIGKFFGMTDIEVGIMDFDDTYIIQGNDKKKVKLLFADTELQRLVRAQDSINFMIRDDSNKIFPTFPEGVDQLYFKCGGVLRDAQRIKALSELFVRVLNRLVRMDSAYEDDPGIRL